MTPFGGDSRIVRSERNDYTNRVWWMLFRRNDDIGAPEPVATPFKFVAGDEASVEGGEASAEDSVSTVNAAILREAAARSPKLAEALTDRECERMRADLVDYLQRHGWHIADEGLMRGRDVRDGSERDFQLHILPAGDLDRLRTAASLLDRLATKVDDVLFSPDARLNEARDIAGEWRDLKAVNS